MLSLRSSGKYSPEVFGFVADMLIMRGELAVQVLWAAPVIRAIFPVAFKRPPCAKSVQIF
jgi:hypothetical protein